MNTMLGQMVSATTCPTCNGAGQIIDKRPAGVDSSGLTSKEDLISIKIPAGVGDGMQLSMAGKGNEAPGGGIPGDLLILIEEQEDKDQISIAKITQFIFDASVRLKLDACETSDGGPAHGPYCVLEHCNRAVLEQAETEIKRYVRRFKGHSLED